MQHSEWMTRAEHLLNTLEQFDYKSAQYRACRTALQAHLTTKVDSEPAHDNEDTEVPDRAPPTQR